jgi:hypothetical protein
MKKQFIPIMVIALLTLTVVGIASAQAPTPPQPEYPEGYYGQGMMGRWSGRGTGMWGRGFRTVEPTDPGSYGPMHDLMLDTFAAAFDISADELGMRIDAGETMWSIAEGIGLSFEQFRDLMIEARDIALKQAVADGLISQEHYDWMLARMNRMWSGEYQPGYRGCYGGFQSGSDMYGGGMYRYNTR